MRTAEAKQMLHSWKLAYQKARREFELSNLNTRWEFDQTSLFKESNFIAMICDDLCQIIDIKLDFCNIFSHKLQSITSIKALTDLMIENIDAKLIAPIQVSRRLSKQYLLTLERWTSLNQCVQIFHNT